MDYIYVDKEWSLGRLLDFIATRFNVSNNNNKLEAENPNRIVLVNGSNRRVLQDLSLKVSEAVHSGAQLILCKAGATPNDYLDE